MVLNSKFLSLLTLLPTAAWAHIAFYDKSMYGFNVTYPFPDWPYDNRPMVPLMGRTFDEWWFHGHKGYPPNDGDVFEFPAGGSVDVQLACNKGYTTFWASSEGRTDISVPDGGACGNEPPNQALHTTGYDDVTGSAIAIVDEEDVDAIQPEDFAIFTTNRKSPWFTHNQFKVPARMPACTGRWCHCAWFWIHSPDSGSMQMFMNGFRCKITNTTSAARKIAQPQVARRCGADTVTPKAADPSNCTNTAMQPLYWYQLDGNNMFEGTYAPPEYNELYGFNDGEQEYIFTDEQGPYEGNLSPAPGVANSTSSSASVALTTSASPTSVSPTSSIASSAAPSITPPAAVVANPAPAVSSPGTSSQDTPTSVPVPQADTAAAQPVCRRRTPEEKRALRQARRAKRLAARAHKKRAKSALSGLFSS